jgi:hypothetical protein
MVILRNLIDREWARTLQRAGGWGIDHSPGSWHLQEARAKAWRLFNRLQGRRLTISQSRMG